MSGTITLQHNAADLLTAYRANIPKASYKRIGIAVLAVIAIGLGVSALVNSDSYWETAIICGAALLWFAFVVLLIRLISFKFWLPRFTQRIYNQQADLRGPITWHWDDERINVSTSNGDTSYPWTDYHQWVKRENMLLIYRSEVMFHFMPIKDNETSQAADDIVACLIKAGVKPKKRT